MNNGFPPGFTRVSDNMGVTCRPSLDQPSALGQQCIMHYVDTTPVPVTDFRHHVSAIQNRAMDTPRLPQKILIDQSELNKGLTTLNKNAERLNISSPSISNKKNELQKQLTQAQSLLSKALTEQSTAKKEAARKVSIANEKEKYFIKKWAYNAIRERCHAVKDRISEGNILYSAIAQDHYQWQDWVDFRTKLIQRENAIKNLDDINLKVNDIRKHIDKIALEIKKIDAKTSASVAKPAATAAAPAAKPAAKVPAPAAKPAANPPAQKSDNFSLSTLASHNFLSHEQQAQKSKELAECHTALCKIGKEAKWAITDLTQGTSFAAGMVAGVPAGLYETVDGIVKTASHPAEAYSALKALAESGNILGNLASAVKQSWTDSIDRMEAEYQKGSISGAFNAGVEGGKLTTDIGGLGMGGAGLLKSGAVAIEKTVVKAASKAESVAKTGVDIALPPAGTTDRMAGYRAPKVVPEPSEAARLASQQTLKSAQFMTMPPLENPFSGKALVDRLTLGTPQQTKVAEQLLDIGIKASITGITAMTLKDVADRVTTDERDPITALSRTRNPAITGDYLSSLQDKYAPAHTGNTQLADTTLRNTGGNLPLAPQAPNHTGNHQISGQGVTHTGNTAGVTDSGIKATITAIPDGPSVDDLAYLAGGYQPNKGAVGNMGEFFKQSGFGILAKDNSQKTSKVYQGQSVYKATGNLNGEIRKGDQYYLDARHKNHLEVFDSKGDFRSVLNLDGSINPNKTKVAAAEGRKLPK